MSLSRTKYRRVTDLYVQGSEVVLDDAEQPTVLWVQVLNPYEMSEARADAATARSRLVLALKEHGSDELTRVRSEISELGRDGVIEYLLERNAQGALLKALDEIQGDPDWQEKLEILGRSEELVARAPEDAERQLAESLHAEYVAEIEARMERERDIEKARLDVLDDEALEQRFIDEHLELRGQEVALAEFRITQAYFGSRVCDARLREDDTWDHAHCEGHRQRAFESKQEVRELPPSLQDIIFTEFSELDMGVVQAKGLGSRASSSGPSRLPSEEAPSASSTPEAAPTSAPGT